MGYVGAVRAGTEVVVMLLIAKAKKLPPYPIMLVASGCLVALEHFLYTQIGSLGGMLLVTCIGTGLAGGMFYGIGANYVFKIVDHRAASTAMAVLGLTKSLVAMLGSGVGGQIIDRFGVLTLTTAVGFISLGFTVLFGLTCALGRFVLKIPYVSERQSV
jgi:MFS family permease